MQQNKLAIKIQSPIHKGLSLISRTFVLQRKLTYDMDIIEVSVPTDGVFVDIITALQKVGKPQNFNYFIYDPTQTKYVDIQNFKVEAPYSVPYSLAQTQFVLIKYDRKVKNDISVNQDLQSNFLGIFQSYPSQKEDHLLSNVNKNFQVSQNWRIQMAEGKQQKSKQRSIQQVLYIVKRWRQIFQNNARNNRRRISFQEAAEIIGISKKSLDDYYLQLRIGQFYGFDFQEHIENGIGFLRQFIKEKQKNELKTKVKYPKQLKIFKKEFQSKLNQQLNNQQLKKQLSQRQFTAASSKDKNEYVALQDPIEQEDEQQRSRIDQISAFLMEQSIEDLQMEFFGNFKSLIDEPNDPIFQFEKVLNKKQDKQFKSLNMFEDFY